MNQPGKPQSYFHNWMTVIGGISSVFLFAVILFFLILDFLAPHEINPYLGVISYFILPVFLIISLLLIPLGAFRERARRQRQTHISRFPHIDFNNPVHQRWAYTSIGVFTLFIMFSLFGMYKAYEFSESVVFCGQLCHTVMEPEYTAYHNSPHARVSCVQCHIGPGAEWYVRAKFRGSYQVYSVFAKKYSKPIKTPIQNLRPAQQTCEQCHWPQQFYGALEQDHKYFLSDENNTAWNTRMLMFVGGGTPPYGKKEGIHWHMNINNRISYVATDEKRQKIPWVRKVGPDGKEEIFVEEGSKFSAGNPPAGEMRTMDCMDCHNRPSHNFRSPAETVNEAMAAGAIDPALPFIKREAVKALLGKYTLTPEAASGIRKHLEEFYQSKYPQVLADKRVQLDKSIEAIQEIYRNNFFPQMKVSWKEYPDNIGHLIFPGCFRCHDGQHKSAEGKVISNQCSVCHNIIEQGTPGAMEKAVDGLEFKHPGDIGEDWKEMNCFDCHTGGSD